MSEYGNWEWAVVQLVNPMEWRLHIWCDRPDGRIVVTGFDEFGGMAVERLDHGVRSDFDGFRIPDSLATILHQAMKPVKDPSGEISRLEESLTVERTRVDKILDAQWR